MNNFYIFLDIDGVLNHYNWFKKVFLHRLNKKGYSKYICPKNIENLNMLIHFLESKLFVPKIVISSTWRIIPNNYEMCKKLLLKYGLDYNEDFDKTCIKYND